jgi:orotidine-5'-phosphate decarboxylase
LILALDGLEFDMSRRMTYLLARKAYAVKAHDLLDREGYRGASMIKAGGAHLLWGDFKFHDIPKTVARRIKAWKAHGVDIVTVHASGGVDMIRAAVETGITVYAVSVLTSLSLEQVKAIYRCEPLEAVERFAGFAAEAKATGLVCSAQEVEYIAKLKLGLELIVPGTRSAGIAAGDQKRSGTPAATLAAGATRLVLASQVTEDPDPQAAWRRVVDEIAAV